MKEQIRWLVPERVEEMYQVINYGRWPVAGMWRVGQTIVVAPVVMVVTSQSHAPVEQLRGGVDGVLGYFSRNGIRITVDSEGLVSQIGSLYYPSEIAELVFIHETEQGGLRLKYRNVSGYDCLRRLCGLSMQQILQLALRLLNERKLEQHLLPRVRKRFWREVAPRLERQVFELARMAAQEVA